LNIIFWHGACVGLIEAIKMKASSEPKLYQATNLANKPITKRIGGPSHENKN
jgi:hypothetical protein